ncbi:MAG TPA: hypothetical protein PKA76_19535 [Pirellulaceae bacterium]|nr:hypothetical protein [Pirellulaceae bacterium]
MPPKKSDENSQEQSRKGLLTVSDVSRWCDLYQDAAMREGWLITNDADDVCIIAKLDDPSSMVDTEDWPEDFTEPVFANDEEAETFVRSLAEAGSFMHKQAWVLACSRIQLDGDSRLVAAQLQLQNYQSRLQYWSERAVELSEECGAALEKTHMIGKRIERQRREIARLEKQ